MLLAQFFSRNCGDPLLLTYTTNNNKFGHSSQREMEIEMQKIFKKFGIKNLKCPPLIQVRPGF
jgi:hypothetical protein